MTNKSKDILPKTSKNDNNESKLSYLAKKLPKEKKEELIEELGITQKTFYNWLKKSENIGINAFALIQTYIDIENGKCYHMIDLLKPIEL